MQKAEKQEIQRLSEKYNLPVRIVQMITRIPWELQKKVVKEIPEDHPGSDFPTFYHPRLGQMYTNERTINRLRKNNHSEDEE